MQLMRRDERKLAQGTNPPKDSRVTPIFVIDANRANLKMARNAAIVFLIATLLFVAQVSAQEAGAKRGAVKGIVSLKGGTPGWFRFRSERPLRCRGEANS